MLATEIGVIELAVDAGRSAQSDCFMNDMFLTCQSRSSVIKNASK